MSDITTRSGKGSPLTNTEMDDNLTNLNADKVETQVLVDWGDPTGWIDQSSITVSYDDVARTVSLSGDLRYRYKGVEKTLGDGANWTSPAHTDASGTYFLYSSDGDTFVWSTIVWGFDDVHISAVLKGSAYALALREIHGLMPWDAHREFHDLLGTYRESGLGATSGTYVLSSDLDADNTPGFDAGVIKDEDNLTTIPATTQNSYTLMKIGAGSEPTFYTAQSFPFRVGTSFPYYNNVVTGADVEASNSRYLNVYELLIPVASDSVSQSYRRLLIQPQTQYTTLAAAQAEEVASLTLGDFGSPEFVFYTRLTYFTANGNSSTGKVTLESITYLTGSRANQANIAAGATPSAENIPFTPYLTLASTNVQAAIQELLDEGASGDVTFEALDANADVGTGADQVAVGNHGHDSLTMDYLALDTLAGHSVTSGQLAWNADENCLNIGQGATTLQVGQEVHYQVRNNTAFTINDGDAVMAVGTLGASGKITVELMDGTDPNLTRYILGIATEDIASGADGKATFFGKVRGLDTTAWIDGDVLWIDPTTPGALTNIEPTAPDVGIPIAFVIYSHASNGSIFVRALLQDEHAHEPFGTVATHESTYNHDNFAETTDITYETLSANGDVGTGATQVAQGDHVHDGRYYTEGEVDSLLNPKIEASDVTYENLSANADVGTGADQVALGSHLHDDRYYTETEIDNRSLRVVNITDIDSPYSASSGEIIEINNSATGTIVINLLDPALCRAPVRFLNLSTQQVEFIQHAPTDTWRRSNGSLLTANYSAITDGLVGEYGVLIPLTDGYIFETEEASISDGTDQTI